MTRTDTPHRTRVPISLPAARRTIKDKLRSTADHPWSGSHPLGIRLCRATEGLWALDPGDDKSFSFSLIEWSDAPVTEWPGDDGRRDLALWLELRAAPDNACSVRGRAVGEMGCRVCRMLLLELGATAQAAMEFAGLHDESCIEAPPAARSGRPRGPTRRTLEVARVMIEIMSQSPHYSQRQLAMAVETHYHQKLGQYHVSVTIDMIRYTLRVMGWSWASLRGGQVQEVPVKKDR